MAKPSVKNTILYIYIYYQIKNKWSSYFEDIFP